ncbi:MAG: hypothetical protein ACI956_000615, partial [Nonlabens sp.]
VVNYHLIEFSYHHQYTFSVIGEDQQLRTGDNLIHNKK